jgi:hypothetical protein
MNILSQEYFINLNNSLVHERSPWLIIILEESITHLSITSGQTNGIDLSMRKTKDDTEEATECND